MLYLSDTESLPVTFGYIERIITIVLIIFYYNKLVKQQNNNVIFINLYILYFLCFFFFSEIRVIQRRMSFLFIFAYTIIYPNMVALLKWNISKQMCIMILMLFFLLKTSQNHISTLSEYHNILFEDQNIAREREFWKKNFWWVSPDKIDK
jgi:hypothetical protein